MDGYVKFGEPYKFIKDKIVIAPEIWKKDGRTVDVYEENWTSIKV